MPSAAAVAKMRENASISTKSARCATKRRCAESASAIAVFLTECAAADGTASASVFVKARDLGDAPCPSPRPLWAMSPTMLG